MGPMGGAHTSGIFADMTVDGPEIGMLVAVFDRAKNLPNRRSMGKQDPYCAARLGKEAKKTATDKRGGQTPRWDQELRFTVHDSPDYHNLKVSVFNDDKKTEMIGETWVSLEEVVIPGGGKSDDWHGLNCKGKYAGEIRMEITYYDTRPKPEKAVPEVKKSMPRENPGDLQMPSIGGPREAAPVKRRPLPSNPTGVSTSPAGLQERLPSVPMPQSAPRSFHTPPRQQPLPTHEVEARHAQKRHTHYGYSTQSTQDRPMQAEIPVEQHIHTEPPSVSAPYEQPPTQTRAGEPTRASRYGDAWRDAATTSKPYSHDQYEPQPIDAMPPVIPHPQERRERAVRRLEMDHDAPTYPPRRPQSYLEHAHANSAPVVPVVSDRRSMIHSNSDLYERSHSLPQSEGSRSPSATYHSEVLQHSPAEYPRQDSYDEQSRGLARANGYQEYSERSPYDSPYGGAARYALQPHVEDENDVPPPPPVHRSSAPAVVEHEQQPPQSYHSELAVAPLRITPSRDTVRDTLFEHSPTYQDQYSPSSHDRRYTHPRERPVSRENNQPSPLRNELPASLIPGYEHSTFETPPDRGSAHDNRLSLRNTPSNQYSPINPYPGSPYDTPSHQRHTSQQEFQTPPNYSTSPRPHPLAQQEHVAPHRSPVYPPVSPADQYALQRVVSQDPPMVKPRPVSPAVASDQRHGRGPSRSTPTRKSVSPRPPVEESKRRLSSTPFGPDDFAAFNPNVPQTRRLTDGGSNAGSFTEPVDAASPILGFDGRVIDPSDHLPVESYAPEPESKGPKRNVPLRERDRLTGARELARRIENDDDEFSRSSLPMLPAPPSDPHTPSSTGRNRLHKPQTRSSNNSAPNSAPSVPGYRERDAPLHTQYSPSPYAVGSRRDAGNRQPQAPPIPAKIPLTASGGDDLARLSEELGRIDIGSGNGTWRRGARGMIQGGSSGRRY